ncbi:MAG: ABC transporter permease [Rhodospirillales bacterium]|nr:MAG: ABC transporter permease [Rhodospirillales bacterium]
MRLSKRQTALLGRRAAQIAPVVVLATFVVFGLLQLVPGDIAVTLAGDNATDARIAEIRRLYGLDRPFLVQYGSWLWNALHGDLSRSILSGEPVLDSILRRFPNTLLIVACALALSLLVGVPLGIAAATRPGGRLDAFVTGFASLGVAIPNFWLAMILVATFALTWNWFPATGAAPVSQDAAKALRHAALPALALAAGGIAEVARQLRGSLVEVLSSQYVRTLHAKGLSPASILWKHGLKNVSVNLLTVIGLLVNRLLGATVVIEAVFAIPGVGGMVVYAAIHKDFPVIQGVVLAMVLIVISLNLLIDVLYTVLDPRVSH